MIKRFIPSSLLVLLLGLVSSLSFADTNPNVVLRDLHKAQLDLNVVAATFHRYQGSEGDKKLLVELNGGLEALKTSFQASLQDLADLGMKTELEQIRDHWRDAARDLNGAMTAIAGKGFAEGQIINGYLASSYKTGNDLKAAYKAVLAKTGVKLPAALQVLRDEQVLFQEMVALYMESSLSQYGYTYRSEAGDETTLDKMAQQFKFGLDDLDKLLSGNPEAFKKANNVRNKWLFLEKSFTNYTENAVPYLVVKFGGEINAELSALALQFDKN